MKYIIITPAKDEGAFINETIKSVISQTILPTKWIIVDDDSSDNTVKIIKAYIKKYGWIRLVINKPDKEKRKYGAKVIRAFYTGYNALDNHDYDFIVKLDADLKLPENYFETVIDTFNSDHRIGITGGFIMNKIKDKLIQDGPIDYHVRGAFKAIRKECWKDINGFREMLGWDGIDEMLAMHKDWKTKVFNLPVVHFRPMAASYNPYKLAIDDGRYHFRLRSSLFLTFVRTFIRLFRKPYVIGGLLFLAGFLQGAFNRDEAIIEKDLSKFINKFHLRRIFSQ